MSVTDLSFNTRSIALHVWNRVRLVVHHHEKSTRPDFLTVEAISHSYYYPVFNTDMSECYQVNYDVLEDE